MLTQQGQEDVRLQPPQMESARRREARAAIHRSTLQFPTKKPTLATSILRGLRIWLCSHLLSQLDVILLTGRVRRRQEIADKEEKQHKFNGGSHGVVLITRLDVAHKYCRTRDFMEVDGGLFEDFTHPGLEGIEFHFFFVSNCLEWLRQLLSILRRVSSRPVVRIYIGLDWKRVVERS